MRYVPVPSLCSVLLSRANTVFRVAEVSSATALLPLVCTLQSTAEVPEYVRTTVLLVCLGVVLRMVFSFLWFYYLFMYVQSHPPMTPGCPIRWPALYPLLSPGLP